jgi:hypothetical protein
VQERRPFDELMRSVLEKVAGWDRASVPTALLPLRKDVEEDLRRRTPALAALDLTPAWERGTVVLGDKARGGRLSDRVLLADLLAVQVFDEQVKLLLTDPDHARQQLGLVLVEPRYKGPVAAVVRGKLPYLASHDLADVWRDTVKNLVQSVRAGTFHPEGELVAFLATIACRRAFDMKRRQKVRQALSLDEAIASLVQASRDSTLGGPTEEDEFRQLLGSAISRLPAKQRQTMESYVTHFPNSMNMNFLRQEVVNASGEDTTVEAVKRNLAVGRRKVSEYLQTQGYTIGAGGEA